MDICPDTFEQEILESLQEADRLARLNARPKMNLNQPRQV
jgi:hypothetical protein